MPTVTEILETLDYGPSRESDAAARDWIAAHQPFGHFIGGKWVAGQGHFPTLNPATGETLAKVAQGSADDIAAAIRAARRAQPGWAKLPGAARARYLYAIARHLQKHERLLSVLEVLDTGKPIREAREADIPLAVRHFYHHAGWADLVDQDFPDHRPHGVCGQIIPWNFPLLMLAWKIAPALAAGNTVVLKPAEQTPLTALRFAQICAEVGLPPGVVNIVTGDGATGAALVAAPVDKIAFTGSTEVGRKIHEQVAGRVPVTLELGGKSPFIVLEDADLDAAVEGVVDGIWFNQGQVCCAGSRLVVAASVARDFTDRLVRRMNGLRVGDPLDKSTDIGAIISAEQADRIRSLVAAGQAAGADLLTPATALPAKGNWVAPAILAGAEPANPASITEIFGPIATLTTFRTPDEAIEIGNATRYGLAASVWSENITQATAVAAGLNAGVIWINATNLFDAGAPFGGWRESGFGREGGAEGMAAYLRLPDPPAPRRAGAVKPAAQTIDRTAKLYIGGAQKRPDGGLSRATDDGLIGIGGRKDIRNAVEAAAKAAGWSRLSGHQRAQVIYFIAENLSQRADALAAQLGRDEVAASLDRLFHWAGRADKDDGRSHDTQAGHLTLTLPAPYGIIGMVAPDAAPLLGLVSLIAPAIAAGNRVVAVPSRRHPMIAADLAQVLDTSDLPGGVVNLIPGDEAELAATLAAHDAVAALWLAGDLDHAPQAAGNLKPVWRIAPRDWSSPRGQGPEFREAARQWKTIWLPYGL
ncbi:aldehyde dehydrogenase family protein [Paracoccus sp. p4-l81]|uniref:aldehyde dehydrogenase family protein n=1 Tax=Paracoccus sp. p4-l81 TaxID=3342806 RepID=UPI0035B7E1ED